MAAAAVLMSNAMRMYRLHLGDEDYTAMLAYLFNIRERVIPTAESATLN